jgi:hypothetical protein
MENAAASLLINCIGFSEQCNMNFKTGGAQTQFGYDTGEKNEDAQ